MDALTKLLKRNNEKTELLVFIIQTLDKEFNAEVQSTDNPIGLIRDKVDRILNKSNAFRETNYIYDYK